MYCLHFVAEKISRELRWLSSYDIGKLWVSFHTSGSAKNSITFFCFLKNHLSFAISPIGRGAGKITLLGRKEVLEGPIFHFHDFGFGRKSRPLEDPPTGKRAGPQPPPSKDVDEMTPIKTGNIIHGYGSTFGYYFRTKNNWKITI